MRKNQEDITGPSTPSKADITYKVSEDYSKMYANGVYGGITPRADLAMDLVQDITSRPLRQTMDVGEKGQLTNVREEEFEKGDIIRERLATVFLSQENARSIAEWILSKVFQVPTQEIHETLQEHFVEEEKKGQGNG